MEVRKQMAIELERLEVIIDANVDKIEQQMQKIAPIVEKYLTMMGKNTTQKTEKMEKDLSIEKGISRFEKQLEMMNKNFKRQMEFMEKQSVKSSEGIGKGLSSGIAKGRKHVSKDIDAMINEINAKMGQAKAKQEQIAFLKSQRQGAVSSNDSKGTIKYDNQIAAAQAQLTKYHETAKGLARSMQQEFEAVPKSLDSIANKMSQNEEQIETMRQKIRRLQSEYVNAKTPTGNFTDGFNSSEDNPTSIKIQESIAKQSTKMNKLIQDSDALQQAYSMLEDRARALEPSLARINTTLNGQSRETEKAESGMRRFGRITEGSRGLFSRFKASVGGFGNLASKGFGMASNSFNRFTSRFISGSSQINKSNNRVTQGLGGMSRRMGQIAKQVLIYAMIYKGIRLMSQGLTSALKTNDQFNQSLNQIKVNLLTAFYPIYEYILPAINALMSALATATGYLASFIATLFGTTYSAAKQGASGLYQSIQAMNESGTAADKNKEKIKQMQRSLMGFDEINNLSKQNDVADADSNKGVDFTVPDQKIPDWVGGWANQAKKLWKDFFKPIKDAWGRQGKPTMDAFKYALDEIERLISSIGTSFMDVWTNGTGQLFVENILKLLEVIFNIIGDIAGAFDRAWNTDGRGLALIQSIFNLHNGILELLTKIGEGFREAWNDGTGERIAGNILEILTNIMIALDNIAGKWTAIFDSPLGKSIINGLLDIVELLLEKVNKLSSIFEEWTRDLNFEPLAEAFDRIVKAAKPIVDTLGDGLLWFFEKVVLPIAKLIIEDTLPTFLDILGGSLEVLGHAINDIKPFIKWLFDTLINPLIDFSISMMSDILEFLGKFTNALLDLLNTDIYSFSDVVEMFKKFGEEIWKGMKEGLKDLGNNAGKFFETAVTEPVTKTAETVSKKTSEIWKEVKETWGKVSRETSETWGKIKIWTGETWEATRKSIADKTSAAWSSVKNKWSDIKTNTSEAWGKVKQSTTDSWESARKTIAEKASSASTTVKSKWDEVRNNTGNAWENIKVKTNETWNNVKDKVSTQAETARSNASTAFANMKTSMGKSLGDLKTNTEEVFGKIAGWAVDLPGKIAKGLRDGVKSIKKASAEIGNGIVGVVGKALNGVINGVKWVLGKVGAKDTADKIATWTIPKYAKGAGYHPGGLAMVNDGSGPNYQEAYQTPDGRQGLFPRQRNLMVNLPRGSAVLSGQRTAQMMAGVPAYKNGVGNWFKEKWDQTKEIASDVWSYASDPSKLLNAAISKFVNLKGVLDPTLSMAKGAVGTTADGALQMITDKFNIGYDRHKEQLSQGSFFGNTGIASNGVYSYLMDIANNLAKKYGMIITSGLRPGDPYDHGKGLAVDIALPGVVNGSPKYRQAADEAINMAGVKYVITNGMWKLKGQSWTQWPDGDHYDHVHISGNKPVAKPTNDPVQGVKSFGTTVDRWQSTAATALRQLGLYSTANMNATMNQIRTESNGNPNAINLWDINAKNGIPSKGLMQVIDPTFKAYARSPYNRNIYDPLSNILASMRYATSRYGSLTNAYKGVGYENGGWVTQEQYRIGEGNKAEMVIPMTRPSRAMELITEALDYLGVDWFDSTISMPEAFTTTSFTQPSKSFADNKATRYEGGGMQQSMEAMINGVMMAIKSMGGSPQRTPDGDIIINIGGKEFGRIAVSEINKYHKALGYTELEV